MQKLFWPAILVFFSILAAQSSFQNPSLDQVPLRDSALDDLKALSPNDAAKTIPKPLPGSPISLKPERWFPDYSMKSSPPEDVQYPLWPEKMPIEAVLGKRKGIRQLVFHENLLVPTLKAEEVKQVILRIEAAPSFPEAIAILRQYLQDIGIIQHFKVLRLIHGSHVAPAIILKTGLLSHEELKSRRILQPHKGSTLGDGVYFHGIETSNWKRNEFGEYKYNVNLPDTSLLFAYGQHYVKFFYLYTAIRRSWGKEAPPDEPYEDFLYELPAYFYDDLKIAGEANATMIFIKRRVIEPKYILGINPLASSQN